MGKQLCIWIINHHACGSGRHANFAKELARRGHIVTLFSASFEHNTFKELKKYSKDQYFIREQGDGFERIYIKTPPYYGNNIKRLYNQLSFSYQCYKAGKIGDLNKPDIIIGSSVHLFTGLTAYFLSKRKGIPFLFEVRDLWPQTLIDLGALKSNSPIALVFKLLEKFLYSKANKIISVLPYGAEYISSIGINEDKVIHIPNGVDLEWFDKYNKINFLSDELNQFFNNKTNSTIFIYTGAHGVANGLDNVVKACEIIQKNDKCHNIAVLLVGEGPEKEKLIKMAKERSLNNIYFSKGVDKDKIPFLLIQSNICISIVKESKVHRYGISMNKIFDYLASGKPILSATEKRKGSISQAKCGLEVDPDSPEKLADGMIYLANLPLEEREKMGKNGRRLAENSYDFRVLTDKLEKLLNESVEK